MKKVTIIIALVLTVLVIRNVLADAPEKITWCHCEPNGNCETLHLPQQALENAGHVNAQGNPLHAGDHAGECVAPTGVVTPTIEASIAPSEVVPTPTITQPTPTTKPDDSPTPIVEPSKTPTPTITPQNTPTPTNRPSSNSTPSTSTPSTTNTTQPGNYPNSSYDNKPVGWK